MTALLTLIGDMKMFADAVEKIAFEMSAPNVYTPRLVTLVNAARECANQAEIARQDEVQRKMAEFEVGQHPARPCDDRDTGRTDSEAT